MKLRMICNKVITLLTLSVFMLCLTSCNEIHDQEYYDENLDSYILLSDYIRNSNNISANDVRMVVNLYEEIDTNDEDVKKAWNIAGERYDFVWLSKNDLIFWNDETKTLGLLNTSNIKQSKKDLDWYNDLEYEKINDEWYVIGQLNHI